ncbi:FIG146278: Maf/YceF/YhdE family protein [hydrothermal vent metagenome]|uniref:FIG146278: Maf/YceF/YhdE family protein n=1 Tax=hydrothermal vent metagenome TaxID=652676 RepID=A0A3B0WMR1_9ZZZZ
MKIVLGSTSPFRKTLLERLHINFECDSPNIDETPLKNESVEKMVVRLAIAKAQAIAENHPKSLIIGSDQSAVLKGEKLSKPGNFENAFKQLTAASRQKITFQTGLCLLNTSTGSIQSSCIPYTVVFKKLTPTIIENYLHKEEPYNCAGSFKSEALGVALFERFEGADPNALIGLPLIELVNFLENESFSILD